MEKLSVVPAHTEPECTRTQSQIQVFAERHRMTVTRDKCNEQIISGKQGHVYDYSATELGVMFIPPDRTPRRWGNLRREALRAGMVLRQDGDSEGSLSFNPNNMTQCRLAMKIAGVKQRRGMSVKQTEVLSRARNRSTAVYKQQLAA